MMVLIASLATMIAVLCSCTYINTKMGMPDDWWGEEITEAVIKQETGLDLDLTPASPES